MKQIRECIAQLEQRVSALEYGVVTNAAAQKQDSDEAFGMLQNLDSLVTDLHKDTGELKDDVQTLKDDLDHRRHLSQRQKSNNFNE